MRPEVNPFVLLLRLVPEKNAGIGPGAGFHGDIAFDRPVAELDILEDGRPHQGLAVEVVDNLGAGEIPALGLERDDFLPGFLGGKSKGEADDGESRDDADSDQSG